VKCFLKGERYAEWSHLKETMLSRIVHELLEIHVMFCNYRETDIVFSVSVIV